jgi:hypothetical protein
MTPDDVPDAEVPHGGGLRDFWVRRFLAKADYDVEIANDWVRYADDMAFVRERRAEQVRRTVRHTRWLLAVSGLAGAVVSSVLAALAVQWITGK